MLSLGAREHHYNAEQRSGRHRLQESRISLFQQPLRHGSQRFSRHLLQISGRLSWCRSYSTFFLRHLWRGKISECLVKPLLPGLMFLSEVRSLLQKKNLKGASIWQAPALPTHIIIGKKGLPRTNTWLFCLFVTD